MHEHTLTCHSYLNKAALEKKKTVTPIPQRLKMRVPSTGGRDLLKAVWPMEKVTGDPNLPIPSSLLIPAPSREGGHRSLCTRQSLEPTAHALQTATSLR